MLEVAVVLPPEREVDASENGVVDEAVCAELLAVAVGDDDAARVVDVATTGVLVAVTSAIATVVPKNALPIMILRTATMRLLRIC